MDGGSKEVISVGERVPDELPACGGVEGRVEVAERDLGVGILGIEGGRGTRGEMKDKR